MAVSHKSDSGISEGKRERVLMLASVASMIRQFNLDNIRILQELGYEVEAACNFVRGNTCADRDIENLKSDLREMRVSCHQVDFDRNPFHFGKNLLAYGQVRQLFREKDYRFVHCHSPIGGMTARIAGHIENIPVIYTAHGFHFYRGAPLKNWLLFYPVEKWLARWTQVLVTVTEEDFRFARRHLRAGHVAHTYGVGVDTQTLDEWQKIAAGRRIRAELGVHRCEKIILSVGELNDNKNFGMVIEALHEMESGCAATGEKSNGRWIYIICGIGENETEYRKMADGYGLKDRMKLLGFRNDLKDIYAAADLFILPSKREGLSVALMEAIAAGVPVICSDIRGNRELVRDGRCRFPAKNKEALKRILREWMDGRLVPDADANRKNLERYDICRVRKKMKTIYERMGGKPFAFGFTGT